MGLLRWFRRLVSTPKAPRTTRQLLEDFALVGPIRCRRCRYDLTGLPPNSKCPECGGSAVFSKLEYLAERTGFSADAFLFFSAAIRQPKLQPVVHCSADDFCVRLRDHALAETGTPQDAVAMLEDWGITRSQEIGAMVYAMVAVGMMGTSAEDRIEDFDGLPDVKGLFGLA